MAKINGVGEYFSDLNGSRGVGEYFSDLSGDPSGIGQVVRDGSLGAQAFRDGSLGHQSAAFRDGSLGATIRPSRPSAGRYLARTVGTGMGASDFYNVDMAGVVVLGVVVRGIAGYFAGCAMDPKYKWWGAGSAAIGGALGLGILGFIVYRKKH